ncbi:DUF6884 domain-containing protein [Rhodococcus jostii]|uniref:DUF6884 domain-containing protein n=1 Tax=Rhodococcus jostii TaxID=132919 RepID=UPI0036479DBA
MAYAPNPYGFMVVYDRECRNPSALPCGARKAADPTPAGALYLGIYHRLCQQAALRLTPLDNIRILSGLHGLLDLGTVIAPYEMRLGEPGSVTVDTVHAQAAAQGLLDAEDVIVLGGRDYSRVVTAGWPHARTSLAGSRGIGEQQQRLHRIAAVAVLDAAELHPKSA